MLKPDPGLHQGLPQMCPFFLRILIKHVTHKEIVPA